MLTEQLTAGEGAGFRCTAEDPDGDALTYVFDWGRADATPGISARFPSGTPGEVTRAFQTAGSFTVRCRAVDEHSREGAWSEPLAFTVQPPQGPDDGKRSLAVEVMGLGRVTSTPSGIDGCTGLCTTRFDVGTQVTLVAEPSPGWRFTGWLRCSLDEAPLTLQVDQDRRCAAGFAPKIAQSAEWQQSGALRPVDGVWGPGGTLLGVLDRLGANGIVRIWNLHLGRAIQVVRLVGADIRAVAWGPEVRDLAVGLADGRLALFDPSTEAPPYLTWNAHSGAVAKVAWHPDGDELASVHNIPTGGAEIRFWSAATGTERREALRVARLVRELHWSPDGQRLAAELQGNEVAFLTLAPGVPVHQFGNAESFAWSPDGARYAVGSYRNARVYVTATHAEQASWQGSWSVASRLAWSPTKDWLVVSDLLRGLVILNANTGTVVADASEPPADPLNGTGYSAVRFHPASDAFVAVEGLPAAVSIFHVDPSEARARRQELLAHQTAITATAWSPSAGQLASAGNDGKVRLWGTSGESLATLDGHGGKAALSLSWGRGGDWLATGGADGRVRIWNAETAASVRAPLQLTPVIENRTPAVEHVALSPAADIVASAGTTALVADKKSSVQVWEVATGAELLHIRQTESPVVALGWTPDGQTLVIVHAQAAWSLWNRQSGQLQLVKPSWAILSAAALSPDGTRLACSHQSGVSILDVRTGGVVASAETWVQQQALTWNPDGTRFAGVGTTGLVFSWEDRGGGHLYPSVIGAHDGWTLGASWRGDGAVISTGGTDTALFTWRAR